MSYFFGQTQTRTTSAADTQAMDAPSDQWPALCAAGNTLACQLAKIPVTTPEQSAQLAQNREAQAQALLTPAALRATSGANTL